MKLDFENNTLQAHAAVEEFSADANFESGSAKANSILQAGIKAAQDGNRYEAKLLLLRATESEPGNEEAWMWLASVSEYPEELLGFLSHVLEINPHNERAREWAKSTKTLLSKTFVERGISASKDAHKDFAKQCFLQAIAQDSENETAWLWLASVSDAEEKTAYLNKVLALNAENENAKFLLKSMKNQKVDGLLQQAIESAVADERKAARQMLEEVLRDTPELVEAWVLKSFLVESFEEKIICFEKILDLNDENELANVNWTALLDIMSKAKTPLPKTAAKQFSAAENNNEEAKLSFAAPQSFDSPEMTADFEPEFVESNSESKEFQPNVEPATAEIFNFGDSQFSEPDEFQKESESTFTAASPQAFDEECEPAAITADYNGFLHAETDFAQEFAEDYSTFDSGELMPPHDNLPSYYENGNAEIAAPEIDYTQEFTETARKVIKETDESAENFEAETPFASNEENFLEENPVAKNFDEIHYNEQSFKQPAETPNLKDSNSVESDFSDLNDYNFGESDSNEPELPAPDFAQASDELLDCPFCHAEGEAHSLVCASCHTMLTLSDLEMLLAHQDIDAEILRTAVAEMEDERNRRDFDASELKLLAVGQINLKNLRQGYSYLEEAAQMNPNDVFLGSQVNFLKIRLAEIEDQQSFHASLPKNRKILVVDDSATVRKLISGKLEKSGHEVFCAVDGIDALEKVKEFVPDLILLDINMPRMDGYQVCKLIRGDELTKDVPVVMISGKDGFFDKVRGRMAGTTGYITKPFGPETLMKMLETYIV